MEIMMLILLYYLSQNPDFPESVKPLMGKLKNSEEMLKFLNDLSRFSEMFALFQKQKPERATPSAAQRSAAPKPKEEPCGKEQKRRIRRPLRTKKKNRPPLRTG